MAEREESRRKKRRREKHIVKREEGEEVEMRESIQKKYCL